MFVSVAYLGDIALDEEDMRMFKVDRIVNLAQRTVTILNHTDTGKCVCTCEFECLCLRVWEWFV